MDKRIKTAFDFIKKNYQQKILLHDLARTVKLSPFYFQKIFKKEMGESPNECIIRIRLERAAHLINVKLNLSMSEIAIDCGFSSLSTFSRAFTKRFGISPSEFQSRSKNSENRATSIITAPFSLPVNIEYFPETPIFYQHTSFYFKNLLSSFYAAKSFCELDGTIAPSGKMYGVMSHISPDEPKTRLNYYAGVVINNKDWIQQKGRVFIIPSGKYACFHTNISYHNVWDLMIQWNKDWLDPRPYSIRDIFAIEEIHPSNKSSDYPCLQRKICIPIQHK